MAVSASAVSNALLDSILSFWSLIMYCSQRPETRGVWLFMRDRAAIPEAHGSSKVAGLDHFRIRRSSLPRPLSWLPRLHEIRRTVQNSVRSHYGRRDLELLFELQPRAAQQLLALLPSVAVGTSRLVETEAMRSFLDRIQTTENVGKEIEAVRQEKKIGRHRRLRSLVQTDDEAVSLNSPPTTVTLRRGRLEVDFQTLEELAAAMYWLARALDGDVEGFAKEYEPAIA